MKNIKKEKFVKAKNCKHSYSAYSKEFGTEEYCIQTESTDRWMYQANLHDNKYNICIKKLTQRFEFPSDKFDELEKEFFKDLL